MFQFQVGPRQVKAKELDILVGNSVEVYPCTFEFDESWDGFSKAVSFVTDGEPMVVLLGEDLQCDIPWELLTEIGKSLFIGCIGMVGTQIVRRTTYKWLGRIKQGAADDISPDRPPTPDICEQLQGEIGDLASLTTEDKTNLVSAVNEVSSKIPGKVSQLENDIPYVDESEFNSTVGNVEFLLSIL